MIIFPSFGELILTLLVLTVLTLLVLTVLTLLILAVLTLLVLAVLTLLILLVLVLIVLVGHFPFLLCYSFAASRVNSLRRNCRVIQMAILRN